MTITVAISDVMASQDLIQHDMLFNRIMSDSIGLLTLHTMGDIIDLMWFISSPATWTLTSGGLTWPQNNNSTWKL